MFEICKLVELANFVQPNVQAVLVYMCQNCSAAVLWGRRDRFATSLLL
jgi:hypothetical protein